MLSYDWLILVGWGLIVVSIPGLLSGLDNPLPLVEVESEKP